MEQYLVTYEYTTDKWDTCKRVTDELVYVKCSKRQTGSIGHNKAKQQIRDRYGMFNVRIINSTYC